MTIGEAVVVALSVIFGLFLTLAAPNIGSLLNLAIFFLVACIFFFIILYVLYWIIARVYPKSNEWGILPWVIGILGFGIILIILIAVLFPQPASVTSTAAVPTPSPNPIPQQVTIIPAASLSTPTPSGVSLTDFSSVTHAEVSVVKGHWTSGAEDDGIVIHPDLRDASGQTFKWYGPALPVDIEIYSTSFDSNYKQVKDKLVYKGTGTISNWEDGNMFMNGGIQVPFTDLNVPSGQNFGWTYVTIHMPDGKTYSAKWELTPFSP